MAGGNYSLLHAHGFVMTAWFLLFGAQTWLVEAHRIDLHRRLGVLGAILSVMTTTQLIMWELFPA